MMTTATRTVDLTKCRPPQIVPSRTTAPARRPCGCLVVNVEQFGHRPYCPTCTPGQVTP